MKVKCRPEDFRVQEIINLRLKPKGAYSIYLLEKKGWNTLDVIRHLEERHRLRPLSRAGLKDRHSHSFQYLSKPGPGPRSIKEKNYSLRLVGMADEPVTREALVGNSFRITLRSLTDDELGAIQAAIPEVRRYGFPNYYDEQRLGSARHGKGFIGRKLIDRHYNGALKLYLATPSAADDPKTRHTKAQIGANWGDWQKCRAFAPAEARPALEYLTLHPRRFDKAVQLLPRTMLELFINAYQAWLWNEILAALLREIRVVAAELSYPFGKLAFYRSLSPADCRYLSGLTIPAPGPKAVFASDRVARITSEVLAREGLELKDLKLGFRIKGLFFKPYDRPAIATPRNLNSVQPEPDELYPGRKKLTLSFFLPSGSFATILIKRLSLFS
ncbi:MAG: tRNA pseudouridine(13) synthase TruD [candidate division WOR-3 bacterium]